MAKTLGNKGFGVLSVLLAIIVLAGLAATGWLVYRQVHHSPSKQAAVPSRQKQVPKPSLADPAEGGKYLHIKEWGVRGLLPDKLRGAVTYSLGDVVPDPDGNMLQAAKIFLASDALESNTCAVTQTASGGGIDTAIQYIRSQTTKPFDAARYRWTFKENILTDNAYAYHLTYVTPDCLGGGDNDVLVKELQGSLARLTTVERPPDD